jgi:hypothetical protein
MRGSSEVGVSKETSIKEGRPCVVVQRDPGNCTHHSSRLQHSQQTATAVQRFVQERRITRTRTVAKDVMDFLHKANHITYDEDSTKSRSAALRTVQRYLKKLGYCTKEARKKERYRIDWRHAINWPVTSMLCRCAPTPKPSIRHVESRWCIIYPSPLQDSLFDPTMKWMSKRKKNTRANACVSLVPLWMVESRIPSSLHYTSSKVGSRRRNTMECLTLTISLYV